MNTLQKTKLRGTGISCGLIVLLFAVVLLLGQVLPDNTYRRVLVPIIWQMCIFILLGTSLNLTLGYLGQLTLGHMGFAGIGAYTVQCILKSDFPVVQGVVMLIATIFVLMNLLVDVITPSWIHESNIPSKEG